MSLFDDFKKFDQKARILEYKLYLLSKNSKFTDEDFERLFNSDSTEKRGTAAEENKNI